MKHIFGLLFCVFYLSISAAGTIQFTAEASPASLSKGESFYLTCKLNAAGTNLRLPPLSDFDVLTPQPDVDRKYSLNTMNGTVQQTATYIYRYVVRAKNEGIFTIAPATITVGTTQHRSNAVTVQVGKQRKNNLPEKAYEDAFIHITSSKTTVYEQEAFLLTYKLFAAERNFRDWNSIIHPDTKGFVVQEISLDPNVQWIPSTYNNRQYHTVLFKQQILQAQQAGTLTIGQGRFEARLDMPIIIKGQAVSRQTVSKMLTSTPLKINVKALPAVKPVSFNNAVGIFRITSETSPAEPQANEAFTLKITISGNGNLKLFRNPAVDFPDSFERFEPKTDTQIKVTTSGISGSRIIEFPAIPRRAGKFVIPPVEFCFFNPETGKYHAIKTQEYRIVVLESNLNSNAVTEPSAGNTNKTNTKNSSLLVFGGVFTGLCLAMLIFVLYTKKKTEKNIDNGATRRKDASVQALKHLKAADKFRKENNEKAFCDELLKAFWTYLSLKLKIPLAELNKDNIESQLRAAQTDDMQIDRVLNTLQTAEMMRYAPTQTANKMGELYEQALEIMKI